MKKEYPVEVPRDLLSYSEIMKVRIFEEINSDGGSFLRYCKIHRIYYKDKPHTNGELRCPRCDEQWLIEHRIRESL